MSTIHGSGWAQLINGIGAPDPSLGVINGYYLDRDANVLYQKFSTGWAQVSDLSGPPGPQGDPGATGAAGAGFQAAQTGQTVDDGSVGFELATLAVDARLDGFIHVSGFGHGEGNGIGVKYGFFVHNRAGNLNIGVEPVSNQIAVGSGADYADFGFSLTDDGGGVLFLTLTGVNGYTIDWRVALEAI